MNAAYEPNGLSVVNNAFRNSEWSNFLATKNGDYYYRLQENPGLVSTNVRKDNGGYFISHTTPWEEFTGLGEPHSIGSKVAYEFPHKTFGDLKASTSKGLYIDNDVSKLGRLHLLYGDRSSGGRSLERVISDKVAKQLGTSPFVHSVTNRPKLSNGFYDRNPVYETLSEGNQTVVSPQVLNNALQNTSYNMYQYSPQGIVKSIYVPYDSGKDIHIKKANRGKFTEAANEHNMGVQEFARQVLSALKGKYSSTLRKRANFARNFAH